MTFIKHMGVLALVATTLTFTGCTQDQANVGDYPSQADGYGQQNNQYNQNNQTNQNHRANRGLFRLGKEDGCNSAKGIVTAGIRNGNEVKYKDSVDYNDGFRKGMKVCAKR